MKKKAYNVGVVGATGLVGEKFIKLLQKRNFPVGKLSLFASPNSQGKTVTAYNWRLVVEALDERSFDGLDLVFFFADAAVSLKYAPIAENRGAIVVDNSSAFRLRDGVSLVVPEINADVIDLSKNRIIANPNCSTIQAILPLANVRKTYGVKRLIFSTYQAASGSGKKGIKDLLLTRQGFSPSYYPLPISQTCLCKIGDETSDGYTAEEIKMSRETSKIFGENIPVSATCVRVPIENCHAVNVDAELERDAPVELLSAAISGVRGVKINDFPSSILAEGIDDVLVGRIRKSTAFDQGLCFTSFADNTLKGAALNAIQIAEYLLFTDAI